MPDYLEVVITTCRNLGEPSSKDIRARPLRGQGFAPDMNVECSSRMREQHPVGTKFIVRCKLTDREGGPPFLYTSYRWPYRVVSDEEAKTFILQRYGSAAARTRKSRKGTSDAR